MSDANLVLPYLDAAARSADQPAPAPQASGRALAVTPRSFTLQRSDAAELLRSLPSESVDLLVTDPAYESLEKHRAIGTTTRLKHSKSSSNDWFSIFPNDRFPELFAEAFRVMKRNTHLYLFCDQETMFVAKPAGEKAGFKFWKPIVWDKCLAPDTPVRSARGVVTIETLTESDLVWTPDGRLVRVLAVRRTRAPAVRVALTNGVVVVAAKDHRFVDAAGRLVEASALKAGDMLATGAHDASAKSEELDLEHCVDDSERVVELPSPSACLFCGRTFESSRAASAHQARFCERAVSKETMAHQLGVAPKRLRRWMSEGRLPASWAKELGFEELTTGRLQLRLQNDVARWFPRSLRLDYGWGKLIGLYAAEGSKSELAVSFALHREEKHLRNHIARMARTLGIPTQFRDHAENGLTVEVCSKMFVELISAFVGGSHATTKFFEPSVYAAPQEFQRGVFDGLIEGDGHWSNEEHRESFCSASLDLAAFVFRFARSLGFSPTIRRRENDHAGAWFVRFDPGMPASRPTVASVEEVGEIELVDIAIDDPDQLFQLHDGVVTHNCRIGMGYHYRSKYELVLFFEKGKRKLADLGVADVLSFPRVHKGYPSEKPSELSEVFIRQSSLPGDLVVDPFCGSGSVGVAALRLGRRFHGGDVSTSALAVAQPRLEASSGTVTDGDAAT